jgi:hypothetical protein
MSLYFILSVVVLAALLFFPVNKLVWIMSVRRMQRKLDRELTEQELDGQKGRARFITVFIVLIFSTLFNLQMLGSGAING